MRKYADFFTDFCIQEPDLVQVDGLKLACAILAFTRKHLNCEIIWSHEMTLLTFTQIENFKHVFDIVEDRYAETFPEHARNQSRHVCKMQVLIGVTETQAII